MFRILVQLFSDAPTSGPWTVAVAASAGSPDLGGAGLYKLDRSAGRNGDVLRAANRIGEVPVYRSSHLGFRCARGD